MSREAQRRLAAFAACLCLGAPLQAAPLAWELHLASTRHSDALPLSRFDSDDPGTALSPRGARNLAYLDNELRLTHRRGAHSWSLLTRQSATVIADRGAIEVAADADTSGRPDGDRQWAVHARYQAFGGSGVAWQHAWAPWARWQIELGVQGLVLRQWRERRIDGQVAYEAAMDSYRFDLQSFEADERMAFPFQRAFAGRGHALLFSGALRWTGDTFGASLAWRDAGRLLWQGLPQQDATLSTDTQSYDADGFVIYRPLVQGTNSQAGRSRRPPLRIALAAEWRPAPRSQVELRGEWLQHFGVLPVLGAEHQIGTARWGLAWHAHERRLGASLAWGALRLRWGADRPGNQAHSRHLSLSGVWAY